MSNITVNFNPTLFKIGIFQIRWYSLAYIFGIIFAWYLIKYLNKTRKLFNEKDIYDDFFSYSVFSIILGGRLGYILFYDFSYYIKHFLNIFKVWNGGMSFHGGLIGVFIGSYFLCKKHKINYLSFLDMLSIVTPIGLFLGRIANFINMELCGRVTTSKIGIIFSNAGNEPRHPSQLYEAFLEGIVIFTTLFLLEKYTLIKNKKGFSSGLFLIMYGLSRIFVEFFREPDIQIGYIFTYFTMGQILSLPF